ncbi:MAG: hypothetical protein NUV68_04550 [Caldiserica bacterium]|nr:hypothetical protein [Caldisericota bacterium]MDH7563248.1 hypothetical protein [Caldisericota bacterium]
MKIEVAPERDGRVVITILPELGKKPEVALKGRENEELPQIVKPEEVVAKTEEEKLQAIEEDPHALEELEEARKEKTFRRATEKQIRYFHLQARKAGIKEAQAWLEENGFPPSSKDCSQAQLSRAIDMLKDLEWARSLEPKGWRREPVEAA